MIVGCASNETFQSQFPIPISNYYYEGNGNKTHFFIEFKQPVSSEIKLEYLYFKNRKAKITLISSQKAEAVLIKPELILDANPEKEFGNQPPIYEKPRFQLKESEAVLEYFDNGKIKHYKFMNVMEKSNK